ncbi:MULTISPECIES: hypothetical protein [Mixta]|uniref:hypothetical protein n=1 Tax=Mixta TaxID=2100764 RepID=UPI00258CAA77|nr:MULTISPECIES: hypothetical protein [Mixta]MBS6056713.1 hypothetical protein [Pantoea sp.]MCR1565729.1 hypothetical protein [Mixta sp.]MDU5191923.1 hypothetical protein [Mixta calida]MDU6415923.1 hypothetical protein [Mixta calida]
MSTDLDTLYHATNEKTVSLWQQESGVGEVMGGGYYHPRKLALAAGLRPTMPAAVHTLFDEVRQLSAEDTLADVLPTEAFHFTFLPITPPLYEEGEALPDKIAQLLSLWQNYQGKSVTIKALRLVALPGQLLLAGIPDEQAIMSRQRFCEAVLASSWRKELLARHEKTPLPAPFWHSTLLRYRAQRLPARLQRYFFHAQHRRYGDVSGELKLAQVNYNWTRCDVI